MRDNVFRRLAVLLVIMLTFSGCTLTTPKAQNGGNVTSIRVALVGEADAAVLSHLNDAVSAITQDKLGFSVTIEVMDSERYERIIANPIYMPDLPDVFVCKNPQDLRKLADASGIIRLNRLLEGRTSLTNAVNDSPYTYLCMVDGYPYGIPFLNSNIYYHGFVMRADICRELGVDPAAITDLNSLAAALRKVQHAYPNLVTVAPDLGEIGSMTGFDSLGDGIGVLFYPGDDLVMNIAESEEFAQICRVMEGWYNDGLILKNASFDTLELEDWIASGLAFGGFQKISEYTLFDFSYQTGYEITSARLSEFRADGDLATEVFCVSASSPYREQCMDFLELLYSDTQLLSLCTYGVEGIDYTRLEDGSISPISGENYSLPSLWPLRFQSAPHIPKTTVGSFGLDFVKSTAHGFVFNELPVQIELYRCEKVMDKYYRALTAGMLDPVEGISMLQAELKEAGVDTVIVEKQNQYMVFAEKNINNPPVD